MASTKGEQTAKQLARRGGSKTEHGASPWSEVSPLLDLYQ